MNDSRPLRVFLCHASQDKPAIRELNERLKSVDWLDPWLDEEKLSLGQHWTTVIEDALDAADIVLIFLSNNSVRREGFVQRELTYAWEISLEKPRDVIFLIPFRLDECEVPRYLRSRQWGDYFGEKKDSAFNALMRSLKERHDYVLRLEAEKRINSDKPTEENSSSEPPKEQLVSDGKNTGLIPDFRIRQRDYLLEVSRSITQLLELDQLIAKVLKISIEMVAAEAGMIFLKDTDGWQIITSSRVSLDFLNATNNLLIEERDPNLKVSELNRRLKELATAASDGLLHGTGLPLVIDEETIGLVFVFRPYPDLFTANDRVILQAFSDQTAIAIRNALLFEEATGKKTLKS